MFEFVLEYIHLKMSIVLYDCFSKKLIEIYTLNHSLLAKRAHLNESVYYHCC